MSSQVTNIFIYLEFSAQVVEKISNFGPCCTKKPRVFRQKSSDARTNSVYYVYPVLPSQLAQRSVYIIYLFRDTFQTSVPRTGIPLQIRLLRLIVFFFRPLVPTEVTTCSLYVHPYVDGEFLQFTVAYGLGTVSFTLGTSHHPIVVQERFAFGRILKYYNVFGQFSIITFGQVVLNLCYVFE